MEVRQQENEPLLDSVVEVSWRVSNLPDDSWGYMWDVVGEMYRLEIPNDSRFVDFSRMVGRRKPRGSRSSKV